LFSCGCFVVEQAQVLDETAVKQPPGRKPASPSQNECMSFIPTAPAATGKSELRDPQANHPRTLTLTKKKIIPLAIRPHPSKHGSETASPHPIPY
jgi:hypothetical protein